MDGVKFGIRRGVNSAVNCFGLRVERCHFVRSELTV
jgi:hypothetical protein